MTDSQEIIKESTSVIQEIENQLEKLLSSKKEDINRSLSGVIQKEKEAARRKIEEVEREFEKEKEALHDYRLMVTESEAERAAILDEIREHMKRALHYQAEIENLAKQTIEESKKVNELQHKLEDLRQRTAESSSFLKKDLRERFGIIAEVPQREEPVLPPPDLDRELEKLKKIKGMLTGEVLSREEKSQPAEPNSKSEPQGLSAESGWDFRIPEIQDLIQIASGPEGEKAEDGLPPVSTLNESESAGDETDSVPLAAADALERLRKAEPTNGSGEINYFQNGDRFVLDAEHLLSTLDKSIEEAGQISVKLEETKSPKELFFIKQELINSQEGLRRLVHRTVKLCENKFPALPTQTSDVLNIRILRDILETLSIGNWANPDEFATFEKDMKGLRAAFLEKSFPAHHFYRSILEDLEGA